jgi:glycosyltransferase involved in cell wall biosynthesis
VHTGLLSLAAIGDEESQMLAHIPERTSGPFRVFSMGRLLHWKGFHLGIEAFARFHRSHPESEYWLIGDGPERHRLEKLARDLSVAASVHFWGELPRAEALAKVAECDLLLHPSLHDSSGWASIEAMAAGRPVICLDAGGLALQIDEGNGVKIPAVSQRQAVDAIAAALENLANNPALLLQYGRAGRLRVSEEFNWACKAREVHAIYDRLLASNPIVAPGAGELQRLGNNPEVPAYRGDSF